MTGLRAWEVATFALCFAAAALVVLALVCAGAPTYRDLFAANGADGATFLLPPDGAAGAQQRRSVDLDGATELHERTLAYVLGAASALPGAPLVRDETEADPLFTADEAAHMADVRALFDSAKVVALVATGVLAALVWRRRKGSLALARLVRTGVGAAGALVAAVALLTALAFDRLFLAFHRLVFPQGNFSFGESSNLLALYPGFYWFGVTLRVGLVFLAFAALVAGAAHLYVRWRSSAR